MSKATHTRSTTTPVPATRRSVLTKGLAAAAVLSSLPAVAGEAEDPVLSVYREWAAARAEWARMVEASENHDWETPECEAVEERETALFFELLDLTPTTMAGIAAMTHVMWDFMGPATRCDLAEEYAEECDQTENRLIRAIWRGASGRDGIPPNVEHEIVVGGANA